MKRVVDNSPAKRCEMLWNSTVRGGVRSGDAPVLARFSGLCVVRSVAHSSRTRACVAEPCACRDVEIRFRLSPERPCILTASAGVWSATCRFRCASPRSQTTRGAAQCRGEREHGIGGQRTMNATIRPSAPSEASCVSGSHTGARTRKTRAPVWISCSRNDSRHCANRR